MPRDDNFKTPRVPSWNGSADTWEEYKKEVELWMAATSQNSDCQLAAKLALELKGPAKKLVQSTWNSDEFEPEEILLPTRYEGEIPRYKTSHRKAVAKLLAKLATSATTFALVECSHNAGLLSCS